MVDQFKIEMAANILRRGKQLAPDRFPKPDMETAQAWAGVLSTLFDNLPFAELWVETVDVWAMELAGDRMVTPKEIRQAAYTVRDRWEADPVKHGLLRKARELAREERDRQIAAGTFGQLRGHKPRAVEPPKPDVPDFVKNIVSKKQLPKGSH